MTIESAENIAKIILPENPFAGLSGKPASSIQATQRLKIALVGKQKSGKSWFACTAPGRIQYYDFDDRAESIETHANKANINIVTLRDLDQSKPTSLKTIESDLSTLKYAKQNGKFIPDTFVFDSVTFLKQCMENELISQSPTLGRGLKLSPTRTLKIGAGWDIVNGVVGYLQYLISEFSQLGNIIFVFHERPEKDYTESTSTTTKYTDQYTVDPQYLAKTLSVFNEVYRIKIDASNNYVVTCKACYEFTASTTLMIDATEKPDIMALIAKHKQRTQNQK
jgi:hypothetical protein